MASFLMAGFKTAGCILTGATLGGIVVRAGSSPRSCQSLFLMPSHLETCHDKDKIQRLPTGQWLQQSDALCCVHIDVFEGLADTVQNYLR